ncbi:MAG TPA: tRNA uridine-5-carboxymethylaminomethyl(34) synthesis GTPase MnmE [Syntrophales bacterium]|jgi:tRNA modification GTPase|nr:tRNA uridine-5-carboxymethylaminomethyl(34) synthesis GTPase MnmE [Syntrophales bacterium]HPC31498.1 tRNA uridine-5-carboxymethylaminomethyl(34) synthesis GTPase MnmE [Syntrophales bacterium]HQG34426.1 tRNA uridine-5-carboxymethylaminomethyl(34) synthesis GTPase MnmE [Syntrophales bacterium]HQI36454.1 tRNA uridine-5-carboxymethylaminomethyl(34) synthesis GTPase MnmE [Syntrophales bacterium]HQJ30072.1 tRNA uridine-5-carboxymethylaminomethyl(34) synthesis GTPase MnmE [Syntrophales bacterium]
MHPDDTIAAIATPPGIGGIAVVRVSGPDAEAIGRKIFRPLHRSLPGFETHRLSHGHIVSPGDGAVIDEVLAVLMRAPRSYTGEDIFEIHGHGGYLLPQRILAATFQAGARPAAPGEFTKRAFLNNRMDLSQAEAVVEMITAPTGRSLELAQSQYRRRLAGEITALRDGIADILARIEAAIDFSAEDPDLGTDMTIPNRLREIGREINSLAATYREGKIYRQGVSLVIAGRTNVGKSSLLNRLLGEKRAIVAPTPGTTRDFIEETVNILDIPVRLADTAGIRITDDTVEQEGIAMVWQRLAAADAVLLVFDGSEELTGEDRKLVAGLTGKALLPVVNKADLPGKLTAASLAEILPDRPATWISAKHGSGMEALQQAIHSFFLTAGESDPHRTVITNLRHKLALEKASFFVCEATARAAGGAAPELTAADLRDALDALEEITGRTVPEMILDRIFAGFCVGK